MSCGEVTHKFDEQTDICHGVKEVLVLKLLRGLVAQGLLEVTSALAVPADEVVVDHLAFYALYVLHLVHDHTSVDQVKKASLDEVDVKLGRALFTLPDHIRLSNFLVGRAGIKGHISANIEVFRDLTLATDNIRDHKYETRLITVLHLRREFLEMTQG